MNVPAQCEMRACRQEEATRSAYDFAQSRQCLVEFLGEGGQARQPAEWWGVETGELVMMLIMMGPRRRGNGGHAG
jgi:D-alanyl-D-alanine dipeptidase